MRVSRVILNNFRPFYGKNEIDLQTSSDNNIIVIGGKNGHGKTSFLVGVVWCLYGKRISDVDEIYKKEAKGGYGKYLAKALNWIARDEGNFKFSVSVDFEKVELPPNIEFDNEKTAKVTIFREYNNRTGEEILNVFINNKPVDLLKSLEDKENFIDEYIIPLEAAKFVFFDAEKISEIAEMNLRKQGRVMNDALGKILGLYLYEELLTDLKSVRNDYKKESATGKINQQIKKFENEKNISLYRLEAIETEKDQISEKIAELKQDITLYDNALTKISGDSIKIDLKSLHQRKTDLENKKEEVSKRLLTFQELIPFSIAAGKLQEIIEQLKKEDEIEANLLKKENLEEKKQEYLQKLFNHPPYPQGTDLNFQEKMFYYEKAGNLFNRILIGEETKGELDFELDLSKSDREHLYFIYEQVQKTSEEVYDKIFNDYSEINEKLNEIERIIMKAEGNMENPILVEYKEKRDELVKKREGLIKNQGQLENEKIKLETKIESIDEKIDNLLNKLDVFKAKKEQIDGITRYINVVNGFIEKQKRERCEKLSQKIFNELQSLMHKKDFINKVEVSILPEKAGLAVDLYDANNDKVPPEALSSGEKQLYISCLLKAILHESVTELPVFIDTPLGRLDKEHKDNILKYYYPNLTSQVVIFPTNEEIGHNRLSMIKDKLHKTYLLKNSNNKTQIEEGYF